MRSSIRRVVAALANIAVFALVLVAGCWAIHSRLPIPDVNEVQAKLERLKAHCNEYDTLFIGTSRIYHHIIPGQFDALMAKEGVPTKSFNAAVDGMRAPENAYMLDQILRFRPQHLRWVFVELDSIRVPVDPAKRGTNRVVYWHDWPRLVLLFRESFDINWPHHPAGVVRAVWAPLAEFWEHLQLFGINMSNMGRGASWMEQMMHPERTEINWDNLGPKGPDGDGFAEIKDTKRNVRLKIDEPDRELFEKRMAERRERPARSDYASDISQDAIWAIIHKIEATGATPVLIVPPTTAQKNFYPRSRDGKTPIVFDFSEMKRYSELYDEKYRLDTDHLNTPGAELFTRLLVERFAEVAKDKATP